MLEFTDKKIGEVQIKLAVTENDIENIVVNAFEVGSNNWLGVDNTRDEFKGKPKEEPTSTWSTKLLLEGKTVYLYDVEDSDGTYQLTLEKILKGIEQNLLKRPLCSNNFDDWDAADCDCVIQYALFSEIVYS